MRFVPAAQPVTLMERTAPETRVEELLFLWRDAQERGLNLSVQALCALEPDLEPLLRSRIASVLEETTPRATGPSSVTSSTIRRDTSGEPVHHNGVATHPSRLGNYEILGRLGEGGMGVVYKARQLGLDRIVALKTIGGHGRPSRHALQRFRAEAQALARLHHPHVVHVYEVGEQDGEPFLVMEYVEGGTLRDLVKAGPLDVKVAVDLVARLARAMHAMHKQGIVHRDLKPANVLLDRDTDDGPWNTAVGCPKLSDFGLVKQLDHGEGLTSDGQLLGTVTYMAPEQARGDSSLIGPATDVYALGALLYELLAGCPPHAGENALQVLDRIKSEPPAPLLQHRPELPQTVADICQRCLEKSVDERYPTAQALAEALESTLNDSPNVHSSLVRNIDSPLGSIQDAPGEPKRQPPLLPDIAASGEMAAPPRATWHSGKSAWRRGTTHTYRSTKAMSRFVLRASLVLLAVGGAVVPLTLLLRSPEEYALTDRRAFNSTARVTSTAPTLDRTLTRRTPTSNDRSSQVSVDSPGPQPPPAATPAPPVPNSPSVSLDVERHPDRDLSRLQGRWETQPGSPMGLVVEIRADLFSFTVERNRRRTTYQPVPFQLVTHGQTNYIELDTTGTKTPVKRFSYRLDGKKLVLQADDGDLKGQHVLERSE